LERIVGKASAIVARLALVNLHVNNGQDSWKGAWERKNKGKGNFTKWVMAEHEETGQQHAKVKW
jgi:hypothetical protein